MDTLNTQVIDGAIKTYEGKPEALLSILHEIQKNQGSISEEAARYLSTKLEVPLSQVFGAASFYKAFSLEKRGKHHIKVCVGTSCYLKNSEKLFERFGRELKITGEGTTEDLGFSLEKVRCMGCCNAGPVVAIDEQPDGSVNVGEAPELPQQEILGEMTHSKIMKIINKYKEEK